MHSDPTSMLTRPRVIQLQAPSAPFSARSPRLAKPPHRTCFLRPRLSPRALGGSPPHAVAAPSQLRLLLRFHPTLSPLGIAPSQLRIVFRSRIAPSLLSIAPSQLRLLLHSRHAPSPLHRSSGFSSSPPRLDPRLFMSAGSPASLKKLFLRMREQQLLSNSY